MPQAVPATSGPLTAQGSVGLGTWFGTGPASQALACVASDAPHDVSQSGVVPVFGAVNSVTQLSAITASQPAWVPYSVTRSPGWHWAMKPHWAVANAAHCTAADGPLSKPPSSPPSEVFFEPLQLIAANAASSRWFLRMVFPRSEGASAECGAGPSVVGTIAERAATEGAGQENESRAAVLR
jgi:hypothetical protein